LTQTLRVSFHGFRKAMYFPSGESCAAGDLGVAEEELAIEDGRQARGGRRLLGGRGRVQRREARDGHRARHEQDGGRRHERRESLHMIELQKGRRTGRRYARGRSSVKAKRNRPVAGPR
jgi:hypothetical protein